MTNKQIAFWSVVVILSVLGGLAYFGLTPFLKNTESTIVQQLAAGSTAGTTFSTAKFAGVAVNLASAGANGSSTSILNGDAFDRYVSSVKVGCEGMGTSKTAYTGTGLSTLQLTVGTSSASAPAELPKAFSNVGASMIIPTSTANYAFASTTSGYNLASSTNSMVWSSGAYMTFGFNATNTAVCTVGVDYFGS